MGSREFGFLGWLGSFAFGFQYSAPLSGETAGFRIDSIAHSAIAALSILSMMFMINERVSNRLYIAS